MLGFINDAAFRTDCSLVVQEFVLKEVNIGKQSCIEFVEDYRVFFDTANKNGYEAGPAVIFLIQQILSNIKFGLHEKLRSYHNCQHNDVICLIIGKMLLNTSIEKEDKRALEDGINFIEKKINKTFDAIAEAYPDLNEKLETHGEVTDLNIDWSIVKNILKDTNYGENLSSLKQYKYPKDELEVAFLAVTEKQLKNLSDAINLSENFNIGTTKQMVEAFYNNIEIDSKHLLLPLFFSPDMKSKDSIYITEGKARDKALKEFLLLIKKDNLNLKELKKHFVNNEKFAHLLPLKNYLKDNHNVEDGNNINSNNSGELDEEVLPINETYDAKSSLEELNSTQKLLGRHLDLFSPAQAYFNHDFYLKYERGEEEFISAGEIIFKLVDKTHPTILIKAERDCQIKTKYLADGDRIKASNIKICRIFEYPINHGLNKNVSNNQPKKNKKELSSNDGFKDIENKLKQLKKLYSDKLISRSVYEQKQKEIMDDFQ